MYYETLAVVLLAVGAYAQVAKSPVIDCETLRLRENVLPNAVTLNSVPFPHHITCVKSVESIRVSVIAGGQANLTDVMLQVHIDGSPSGLFFNFDRDIYATDCNGKALYSRDRMAKKRVDALWFNIMGISLATRRTACVITLVDTMNKAWQSMEVPAVWDEGVQRQALLEPRSNTFAENAGSSTAAPSVSSTTTLPSSTSIAPVVQTNRASSGGMQDAEPSKILDISLGMFNRRPSPQRSAAVPFSSQPRGASSRSAPVGRFDTVGTRNEFSQQREISAPAAELQQTETTTTSAPTTTTLRTTTRTSPPTTTTTTTTTTTPATTATTPTTTTTTPTTTTTTTPTTTTTTTPTTTTTTTTTTPITTTTSPTTTTTARTTTTTARRPTRPIQVTTTPTTTTRRTTTTVATTTTTQPVNLDMGRITVEGRTYEHHCLNGNLKRVLVPHTGCRSFVTLMNALPGAFSTCPLARRGVQTCFDVVTCMCVPCHFNTCPPSFDPQRRFNVTIYNPQREPIGSITGEHVPNRNGGFNENVSRTGIIDPGYLPLRNPDGSVVTTPSPAWRSPAAPSSRRGANRGRGSRPRQTGINGVISNLLSFF